MRLAARRTGTLRTAARYTPLLAPEIVDDVLWPPRRGGQAMDTRKIKQQLLDLRCLLQARRQRLDRHLHHRDEPLSADSEERASELQNRETLHELDDGATVELGQIERALARIERGDFGTCEQCRGRIGEARLELLPFASRCARCAGG